MPRPPISAVLRTLCVRDAQLASLAVLRRPARFARIHKVRMRAISLVLQFAGLLNFWPRVSPTDRVRKFASKGVTGWYVVNFGHVCPC